MCAAASALRNIPDRPVAFCEYCATREFRVPALREAGVTPAAKSFYRDHHGYTEYDIRDLLKLREQTRANGFVTTEKDAINLARFRTALDPLAVVPVTVELLDSDNVVDIMLRTIHERRAPA